MVIQYRSNNIKYPSNNEINNSNLINITPDNSKIIIKETYRLAKTNRRQSLWIIFDIVTLLFNIGLLVYFIIIKFRMFKNINKLLMDKNKKKYVDDIIFDLEKSISIYSFLTILYSVIFISEIIKIKNNQHNYTNKYFLWFHIIFLTISLLYTISITIVDSEYLKLFIKVKNEHLTQIPSIGHNYHIFLLLVAIFSVIFSIITLWHDIWAVYQ